MDTEVELYDQKNLTGGLRLLCMFVLLLSCVLILVFNFQFLCFSVFQYSHL